jgi:hypothetical protein
VDERGGERVPVVAGEVAGVLLGVLAAGAGDDADGEQQPAAVAVAVAERRVDWCRG